MSKKNRPERRPDQPAPTPSAAAGGNSLQFATLIAIAILAVVSWASWRDVGKLEESLQTKLGEIETRIAQVSKKVDDVAAARPQLPPQARRLNAPDPDKVYTVKTDRSPIRGPKDAPITIAAFSDFQWPYCARVGPTLDQIQKVYGDQVKIAWKHHPLEMHKDAPLAHQASEAARKQGKFWEYHDKLFADTKKLKRENLLQYARDLNLDIEQFEKDLTDLENKKLIDSDAMEAITLGATGTPAFFVNGRYLSGAQPFETFAALINEELEKKNLPVPDGAKVQ